MEPTETGAFPNREGSLKVDFQNQSPAIEKIAKATTKTKKILKYLLESRGVFNQEEKFFNIIHSIFLSLFKLVLLKRLTRTRKYGVIENRWHHRLSFGNLNFSRAPSKSTLGNNTITLMAKTTCISGEPTNRDM